MATMKHAAVNLCSKFGLHLAGHGPCNDHVKIMARPSAQHTSGVSGRLAMEVQCAGGGAMPWSCGWKGQANSTTHIMCARQDC
eukprot:6012916-Lingulodinium_polyedra.AAC.2